MHARARRAVIAALLVIASPATAQEPPPPRRAPRTSVGASIGLGGTAAAPLPAVSTAVGSTLSSSSPLPIAPTPTLGLFLELRMSRKAWLLFQAQAAYGTSLDGPDSNVGSFGVGLGVRSVFNPDALVEISTFMTAGVGYATSTTTATTGGVSASSSGSATSAGVTWGFAFERELVEALYLRLSSGFLGVTWTGTNRRSSGDPDAIVAAPRSSDTLAVGLRFSPAIEIRYAF